MISFSIKRLWTRACAFYRSHKQAAILTTGFSSTKGVIDHRCCFCAKFRLHHQTKDAIIILFLRCSSSLKSLLLQPVSSQPKVTIINNHISYCLTIDFETKTICHSGVGFNSVSWLSFQFQLLISKAI